MSQIGTYKMDNGDGNKILVPVFNMGDVDYPVIRCSVSGGNKGAMPFYPLGEEPAHNDVRIYHPNYGKMALHDDAQIIEIIDDFEDGNLNEYNVLPGTGSASVTTGASYEGTYGLELGGNGNQRLWTRNLPVLPSTGTRFAVYWKCSTQTSPEFWFGCGGSGDMDNGRYQMEYFWDGNFQIRSYVSGNEDNKWQSGDNPVNLSTGTWYIFMVDWKVSGNTYDIEAYLLPSNVDITDDNVTNQALGTLKFNDDTHNLDGIGFEGDGVNNGLTRFDYAVRIPR